MRSNCRLTFCLKSPQIIALGVFTVKIIYYPNEKLELLKESIKPEERDDWTMETLQFLVDVVKRVSSKYTRSKVRRAIPEEYRYVVEEMITEKEEI